MPVRLLRVVCTLEGGNDVLAAAVVEYAYRHPCASFFSATETYAMRPVARISVLVRIDPPFSLRCATPQVDYVHAEEKHPSAFVPDKEQSEQRDATT